MRAAGAVPSAASALDRAFGEVAPPEPGGVPDRVLLTAAATGPDRAPDLPGAELFPAAVAPDYSPARALLRAAEQPPSRASLVDGAPDRVWSVAESADAVARLRRPLATALRFPFHPHITLAHEVDDDALDAAARDGAGIAARFVVERIRLHRLADDGSWQVLAAPALAGRAQRAGAGSGTAGSGRAPASLGA